jgi:aspartate racemase
MRKVGLVGGIGPESTLLYYQGIIDGYRKRTGNDEYPKMIIDSLDLTEMYNLADKKDWANFTDRLSDSIECLVAGGAEVAAMAANTAHIVFHRVAERSTIPLISIVEETCIYAKARGLKRAIVFGTGFTMSSGLFDEAFGRHGMEAFVPPLKEQSVIHNIIFPHLQEGIVVPEEKSTVLAIANRMIEEKGADALVLGCTELPLIIKPGDLPVAVLDTTEIHISSIVDYLVK